MFFGLTLLVLPLQGDRTSMIQFLASRKKKITICFPINTVNCRFSLFVSYNHSTGGYVQDVEYGNTAQLGDCHGKT